MQLLSRDDGVEKVLEALLANRLAALFGAGLSMAPPSVLPSAAALAAKAKESYDAMWGNTRPPLSPDIEEQAQYFFERGELCTVYLRTLIDPHAFAGRPNPGHYAIADLLLVNGIQTGVTTNVDTLVESAGQILFGQIGAGIDRNSVAALRPDMSPLLKIHGCRSQLESTIWAPGQLQVEPIAGRIQTNADWLRNRLLDRDLLVVGYSTDWDYLNQLLRDSLNAVRPARVIVVDPIETSAFAEKAPELHAVGATAAEFWHVRLSGSEFLDEVREAFSKSFIRRALHLGAGQYGQAVGYAPDPAWMEPPDMDNITLWQIRRDLEGRRPNEPAECKDPPSESLIGLTLLQLRARGAIPDGPYWLLNGTRIRVLRAANKTLHQVQGEFEREVAPAVAADVVIAVGAEAQALPKSVVRPNSEATIARGNASRWMTRPEAVEEFEL